MCKGARLWTWWVFVLGAVAGARELDPAACAARFDVQRDKIIRTEESREMGARYISELDVGARAECMRLCCETDLCDVFVYEEKGAGSCYLFKCGPPEDFRCKFTTHGNFSSGVLALSRRLAELQDQERRAHHETELANLRSATSTSTSTAAPRAAAAAAAVTQHHPTRTPGGGPGAGSGCSRYQFACRSGGECIAVYNACDGVPQCADGSDEAPELGCPTPPPPPTTLQESAENAAEPDAGVGPHVGVGVGAGVGAGVGVEEQRWPHRLAQAQPPRVFSAESGGGGVGAVHIFSHKGGLVQGAGASAGAGAAPGYMEAGAPWPRRPWGHVPGGVSETVAGGVGWGGYPRDWDRGWPPPPPAPLSGAGPAPPRLDPERQEYAAGVGVSSGSEGGAGGGRTMPEVGELYAGAGGAHTLRDSAKKGPAPGPPAAAHPAPPAPAPPALVPHHAVPADHTPKKPEPRRQAAAAERQERQERQEQQERQERPAAAVLLLAAGVALTAALAALAACRARAARSRRARGKPFAHDADYLVNGMYL